MPRARSRMVASTSVAWPWTSTVQFPDAGLYWYHPHIREDFAQEMGLYGTIRERTDSTIRGIALHIVHNTAVVIAVFLITGWR